MATEKLNPTKITITRFLLGGYCDWTWLLGWMQAEKLEKLKLQRSVHGRRWSSNNAFFWMSVHHVWTHVGIIIDHHWFKCFRPVSKYKPSQSKSSFIPTYPNYRMFSQKQANIQPTPTASWLNANWRGDHPSVGWAHGAPGLLGAPIPKHLADDFSPPDQQIPETWDLEHWNLGSHQTQWDQTHEWWIWICCVMLVPGSCWYRAHYSTNDTNEGVTLTDSESNMSNLVIWLRRIGNIQPLRTYLFLWRNHDLWSTTFTLTCTLFPKHEYGTTFALILCQSMYVVENFCVVCVFFQTLGASCW